MLTDLAALVPPFLVATAFLVGVGAFIRHEMRAAKKQATDEHDDVDEPSTTDQVRDQGSDAAS